MIHENARSELEDSTRKDLVYHNGHESVDHVVEEASLDTTRRSLRRILRSLCVRLQARVSAWKCVFLACHVALKAGSQGAEAWRPKAIVVVALASGLAATAYAKESSMEGSLWHGTP